MKYMSSRPPDHFPLEQAWLNNPIYTTLDEFSKIKSQKYLDKLYTHGITTLAQLQNTNTTAILTQEEYRTIYKYIPKTIKEALRQATIIFPTTTPTHLPNHLQTTPTNITLDLTRQSHHIDPTLGHVIYEIMDIKITNRKGKWGAQTTKRKYQCQWLTPHGITQQRRQEDDLLHPDNILFEHNLLLTTRYHTTTHKQKAT